MHAFFIHDIEINGFSDGMGMVGSIKKVFFQGGKGHLFPCFFVGEGKASFKGRNDALVIRQKGEIGCFKVYRRGTDAKVKATFLVGAITGK